MGPARTRLWCAWVVHCLPALSPCLDGCLADRCCPRCLAWLRLHWLLTPSIYSAPRRLCLLRPWRLPFLLQALKELCDKCRFPMPQYTETRGQDGHTTVAVALAQAGIAGVTGPPNEDRKQARTLAVQLVMDALWKQHPPQPMPAV